MSVTWFLTLYTPVGYTDVIPARHIFRKKIDVLKRSRVDLSYVVSSRNVKRRSKTTFEKKNEVFTLLAHKENKKPIALFCLGKNILFEQVEYFSKSWDVF